MKNYLIQFITGIIFYKKAFVFLMNNKLLYFLIFPIIINIFLSYIGFYFTDMISNYLHDQMLLLINSKLDSVILEGGVLSTLISISLWIISKIFFIFLFLTCSGYLTILILSPVFSFLSEKIAAIHNGYSNTLTLRQFLNDILRAGVIAFRNILIQLSLNILFFLIGFFPVVGWVVSIFGNIIVTSYFYGFSFMDFSNERNRLSVKESVIFIRKKSGLAIGIGFVFYSCLLIPFVGSFLASLLSVFSLTAATLSFEEMSINSTAFQSTESLH